MNVVNTIISLIIGWGLGLLSPFVVEKIKLRKKKRELLNGIITELRDVRIKLAGASFLLGKEAGKFDREFLAWCLPVFRDYEGPEPTKNILKSIEMLLTQNDEQIERFKKITKLPEGVGLSLKHYEIPFTQSKLGEISIFNIKIQNMILNIRSHIDLLNSEIDIAMKYHFMTYDSSISIENHKRLTIDIKKRFANIQGMAMQIADRIGEFIKISNNLDISEF